MNKIKAKQGNSKTWHSIRESVEREHVFKLTVKGANKKRNAELAVLSAFALRRPDGLSFDLK